MCLLFTWYGGQRDFFRERGPGAVTFSSVFLPPKSVAKVWGQRQMLVWLFLLPGALSTGTLAHLYGRPAPRSSNTAWIALRMDGGRDNAEVI